MPLFFEFKQNDPDKQLYYRFTPVSRLQPNLLTHSSNSNTAYHRLTQPLRQGFIKPFIIRVELYCGGAIPESDDDGAPAVSSCCHSQRGTTVPTGPLSLHTRILNNGSDDPVDGVEYHIFLVPF